MAATEGLDAWPRLPPDKLLKKMLHPAFRTPFMAVIMDALPFGVVMWKPAPLTFADQ